MGNEDLLLTMNILINASNLKQGGGVQVAKSVCSLLKSYKKHHFIIVLSTVFEDTQTWQSDNVDIFFYDLPHSWRQLLFGRDVFLDKVVCERSVDVVLTIFGPSIWIPRVPHLCGFARAQLLLKDSPYYKTVSFREKVKFKLWKFYFKKCSKVFYTENGYISKLLQRSFGNNIKAHTVTNYYNQIFDQPEIWKNKLLPAFDGTSLLDITTAYPHKNINISIDIANYLIKKHPNFSFRFVFTINQDEFPELDNDLSNHFLFIGKVDISECPSLYKQCDIAFQPTLMECFTATYPEAMRMEKPIVTTDLEFARGLCGDAACYYSAIDAKSAAEAIYKVATDKAYAKQLVDNGKKQLQTYDNYVQRTEKLIKILENLV